MTTNLIFFKNQKQQKNRFDDTIISVGVIGDIAGQAIQNLNNENLNELTGKKNSDLKNFLGIYEYTDDELLEMEKQSVNTVERAGNHYYISGNNTNISDKTKIYAYLNVRIIKLFIYKELNIFLENLIGRNVTDKKIESELNKKLQSIARKVKKFLHDFSYTIDFNYVSGLIEINLYASFNEPISKISVNVRNLS